MSKAEQFVKDYTSNCSNETIYGGEYMPWLTPEQALRAVEIARNEVIDKACEFMETYPHMFMGVMRTEMIEDFKNHMKGE